MIVLDAHVYAYYLWQTKGNMRKAAGMAYIGVDAFRNKMLAYGLNFRDFRGSMCTCNKGKPRCETCKARNRVTAKSRYYRNENNKPAIVAQSNSKNNAEKINRMMVLSNRMAAMQRFLQLSK